MQCLFAASSWTIFHSFIISIPLPPSLSNDSNTGGRPRRFAAFTASQPASYKMWFAMPQPQGQPRLACPFQKYNPKRYADCGLREDGFRTVAQMERHLRRCHQRNPNYCPRCMQEFSTELEKNTHVRQAILNPCAEGHGILPEGVSPEVFAWLERRDTLRMTTEEQWYGVWDVIFPTLSGPTTCTFDLEPQMRRDRAEENCFALSSTAKGPKFSRNFPL